jgi:hypothetical protein
MADAFPDQNFIIAGLLNGMLGGWASTDILKETDAFFTEHPIPQATRTLKSVPIRTPKLAASNLLTICMFVSLFVSDVCSSACRQLSESIMTKATRLARESADVAAWVAANKA